METHTNCCSPEGRHSRPPHPEEAEEDAIEERRAQGLPIHDDVIFIAPQPLPPSSPVCRQHGAICPGQHVPGGIQAMLVVVAIVSGMMVLGSYLLAKVGR